jgi:hypothetical protein
MRVRLLALAFTILAVSACRPVADPDTIRETPADSAPTGEPNPLTFVDLFVTDNYGCALANDGQAWCWGDDPAATMGLRRAGRSWQHATPLADLPPLAAIHGDEYRMCAATADGQVLCWRGPSREYPDGHAPQPVPGLSGVVDIEVANNVCARTRTGDVLCSSITGNNLQQLASNAIDFTLGVTGGFKLSRACSLDAKGGVWCWDGFANKIVHGPDPYPGPFEIGEHGELLMARLPGAVQIEVGGSKEDLLVRMVTGEVLIEPAVTRELALPLTNFTAIPAATDTLAFAYGEAHGCVVARAQQNQARELRCFHGNGWAQLGAGDSAPHDEAVIVTGIDGDIVDVAASRTLSCASTRSGVSCWGTWIPYYNTYYASPSNEGPIQVATGVASVAVDFFRTCASMLDGRNLCWGATGRTGFEFAGAGIFTAATAQPLGPELGRLAGIDGFAAWDETGRMLWAPPTSSTFPIQAQAPLQRDGVTACVDPDRPCCLQNGALHCVDRDERPRAVPKLRKPTAIASSRDVVCAIHDGGKIGCFVLPELDPEHDANAVPELETIRDFDDVVQLVGASQGPSPCFTALDKAGTVRPFCLHPGVNGMSTEQLQPLAFEPTEQIIESNLGICGRSRTGKIMCGRASDKEVVTHELPDIVAIAGSQSHWCALAKDGTLTCMGDNSHGQLGTLPRSVIATPLAIEFQR